MDGKMQRAVIARILRRIAAAIEQSDVADLENFNIDLKPSLGRKSARSSGSQPSRKVKISTSEVEYLLDQLNKSQTREAAFELLERMNLTRNELIAVARPRNVHVTKDDDVRRIKEKLVEAAIGSRLNSLAIRGT